MKQSTLDRQLHQFMTSESEDALYNYCAPLTPKFPVCMDLRDCVERTLEFLENAIIVYSGYRKEEIASFAAAAQQMVRQELATGRWEAMPADETAAAGVIAQRAFDALTNSKAEIWDPGKVYLVIGMYAYSAVLCNEGLDAWSFVHLFVLGWLIYFSEKLSMPAMMEQQAGKARS